ncbi:hypothetical protein LCGC14_2292080 [marine sediment metagenome]|uniref:Uncharacterized protein n=1 Tax=marine sediment metagenome TaxID=412755 RepID=A0A0F9FL74_9ZZZZ
MPIEKESKYFKHFRKWWMLNKMKRPEPKKVKRTSKYAEALKEHLELEVWRANHHKQEEKRRLNNHNKLHDNDGLNMAKKKSTKKGAK